MMVTRRTRRRSAGSYPGSIMTPDPLGPRRLSNVPDAGHNFIERERLADAGRQLHAASSLNGVVPS